MIKIVAIYLAAAICEIAGCFGFWTWLRQGRSAWWLLPSVLALITFAWLLMRVDTAVAGHAFAA
jgi:small multidrug resistance family-3 protein